MCSVGVAVEIPCAQATCFCAYNPTRRESELFAYAMSFSQRRESESIRPFVMV